MARELLLCVNTPDEVELVAALGKCPEFKVIRRCVDEIELTSVALAGAGEIAVIVPTEGELLPELALALLDNQVLPVLWGEKAYPVPGVECVETQRIDELIEQLLVLAQQDQLVMPAATAADTGEQAANTTNVAAETDTVPAVKMAETECVNTSTALREKPPVATLAACAAQLQTELDQATVIKPPANPVLPPPPPPGVVSNTESTGKEQQNPLADHNCPDQESSASTKITTHDSDDAVPGSDDEQEIELHRDKTSNSTRTRWHWLRRRQQPAKTAQLKTEIATQSANSSGQLIAVSGTYGGPGRTTIALALARTYAQSTPTVLVDADNYAPSQLETIGLTPPHPNLLDLLKNKENELPGVAIANNLEFIGGIPGAHRWREARPEAVVQRLKELRESGKIVVVDLAAYNPPGTAISYGPDRDALTREICAAADTVVLVGRADTVGIIRLTRLLHLTEFTQISPQIVVNQVSVAAGGKGVCRSIRDMLARSGFPQVTILRHNDEIARSVLYRRDWDNDSDDRVSLTKLALAAIQH